LVAYLLVVLIALLLFVGAPAAVLLATPLVPD